jgi:hypothetical protein
MICVLSLALTAAINDENTALYTDTSETRVGAGSACAVGALRGSQADVVDHLDDVAGAVPDDKCYKRTMQDGALRTGSR